MNLAREDFVKIEQLLVKHIDSLRKDINEDLDDKLDEKLSSIKLNQKTILERLEELVLETLPKRFEKNEREIVSIKDHLNLS
jgi:hypothetical protein